MNYVQMGAKIRAKRKELHLTQEQLAKQAGVTSSFMGHIERGTRVASLETFLAICKALNLSSDYLLGLSVESAIKPILTEFTQEELQTVVRFLQMLNEI